MAISNREQWLLAGVKRINDLVFPEDEKCPKVRVSVGIPKGSRGKGSHSIGQCFSVICADDDVSQMFISPELIEPVKVLDVLTHEMVHAAVGCENGHKGPFKQLARAIGLEGKLTATVAGETLTRTLDRIVGELGKYPHAKLDYAASGMKKQKTRLLKAQPPCCDIVIRVTAKFEDNLPTCTAHGDLFRFVDKDGMPLDADAWD